MDLHYSQTLERRYGSWTGFTTLWIYTILKRRVTQRSYKASFTTLWIYTILKLLGFIASAGLVLLPYGFTLFSNTANRCNILRAVLLPYGFTLFSNKKYSQTLPVKFYYLMDLHYSQTLSMVGLPQICFTTLWIYTILKRRRHRCGRCFCFTTLWIYTILKQADQ